MVQTVGCASMTKVTKFNPSAVVSNKRRLCCPFSCHFRSLGESQGACGTQRGNGGICNEKTAFRLAGACCAVNGGTSQRTSQSGERSGYPGVRSGCLFHRPSAGERQCTIPVSISRGEVSLCVSGAQSSLRQRASEVRAAIRRLLRVRCQPGKDCS